MNKMCFDEKAALVAAKQGDRAAFGSLVHYYQRQAYATAYSVVGNRDDALELAQDAFVKAYRAIDRFDTKMPFYPWLYRIIKNTGINFLKKKKRRGESSLDRMMDSGYDAPDKRDTPDQTAEKGYLRASIRAAIDALSEEHREIIHLRHFQELSYAEMAQCLEIPQGTVMSRLHSARKQLRLIIEQHNEKKLIPAS